MNAQDKWALVLEYAMEHANEAPVSIRSYVPAICECANVPRQQKKFINFAKNSIRLHSPPLLDELWNFLESMKAKAMPDTPDDEVKTAPAVGASEPTKCDEKVSETVSKDKKSKDKKKRDKESEEDNKESEEVVVEMPPKKVKKSKKKKDKEKVENVHKEESSAVPVVTAEATEEEEEIEGNDDKMSKKKKKSKKRKQEQDGVSEESVHKKAK